MSDSNRIQATLMLQDRLLLNQALFSWRIDMCVELLLGIGEKNASFGTVSEGANADSLDKRKDYIPSAAIAMKQTPAIQQYLKLTE